MSYNPFDRDHWYARYHGHIARRNQQHGLGPDDPPSERSLREALADAEDEKTRLRPIFERPWWKK